MPTIYLQTPLPGAQYAALKKEFPFYKWVSECKTAADFADIEVFFGNKLGEKELNLAEKLKWVHSTEAQIHDFCTHEIHKKNILFSLTKGENVPQMAEFVIGSMLAFAKQFFHWPQAPHEPSEFWQWPLRDTMWTLNKKTLLQIGLGNVGTEIVKMANSLGMKSWGLRKERSFHPYCKKTFSASALHSLLPAADVVVLALPKMHKKEILFKKEEFELMKPDSIFIVIGSGDFVDEKALAEVGKRGKFRGVLLDAYANPPPAKNSPLRNIPNVILTPSVASFPEAAERLAFPLFRHNLRMFVRGKIQEMKNLVSDD